ncbi:MAG: alpha/beta hydrolase [Muribaculaceae bacterium]|nr:alpha/beta hydrolase [Muribaculaceae bacterium]
MSDKELEINGVKFHYRVSGEGRPVVLMHGWGCNLTTVASIEAIAAEAHTVYNVDFPGFGESSEPPAVWGVEEYTRLIEELCITESISNPILIGHSFGGRVAILFASRNSTDKVVLVDAAGIKPRHSLRYYFKVYTFKAGKHLTRLFLGKEKAEKRIEAMRKKAGSSDYNNASPKMRAILSKVVNEDLTNKLHLIKSPTLLVWGENDTATPLRDAKIMEREIPDAGLVSFPGCGHYSFLDNPRQFAAVLRSFINNKES